MYHAGWVSHPGVFTPGPGVEATDVAMGVWYHPVTQAVCTHAQAPRPPQVDWSSGGCGCRLGPGSYR
eukprot:14834602-Alexandrium_andersonii.AAC.1